MVRAIQTQIEGEKPNIQLSSLITLLLWGIYSTFQIIFLDQPFVDLIGFLAGILAIAVLLTSGFSLTDCHLRFAPISKRAAWLYVVIFLLWLGVVLPTGGKPHWDWQAIFIFAPATAIAQEIFFRSALLPVLFHTLKGNFGWALFIHSILFAIWHMGVLTTNAPPAAAMAVILVPFLISFAWGWQVHRDRTVLWAILHHTLLQMVMRIFTWG
jgi:membrane protease YdiL (CAAX protease family)